MYLDPGFGGMLVQVIVAIVAVGGGIIYSLRRKIRSLFSKNKEEVKPINFAETNDDAEDMLSNDEDRKV